MLESMFNKAMGLRPATLLKKEITAQLHSCEVCYIFQKSFFVEILRVTASQTNFSFLFVSGDKKSILSDHGSLVHEEELLYMR